MAKQLIVVAILLFVGFAGCGACARKLWPEEPPKPAVSNLTPPANPELRRTRIAQEVTMHIRDTGFVGGAQSREKDATLAIDLRFGVGFKVVPLHCDGFVESVRKGVYWNEEEREKFPEILRVAGFKHLECSDRERVFTLDL